MRNHSKAGVLFEKGLICNILKYYETIIKSTVSISSIGLHFILALLNVLPITLFYHMK